MKTLNILITFLLLVSSHSFAEWLDGSKQDKELTLEDTVPLTLDDIVPFVEKLDKQFFIPHDKSKKGLHIYAMDLQYLLSNVALRHLNNSVDYNVNILKPINDKDCHVFLDLLDDDRFLIKSIPIDAVHKNFTGNILGQFTMKVDVFKTVKYYKVSFRY